MRERKAAIVLGVLFISLSAALKHFGEDVWINSQLFTIINGLQFPVINPVMLALSEYGREEVWIPVVLLLWWFGDRSHKRAAFLLAAAFVLAIILGEVSKSVMAEPRPFKIISSDKVLGVPPTDFSFPSGHAVIVSTGALIVLSTLPKKFSVPLLAEAILVSYSRLYIGVHWPLDVAGGWLLGGFCAGLILSEEERLRPAYEFFVELWDRIVYSVRYQRPTAEEEETEEEEEE
jgi:membrane-associated phospholipid phosphatase